MFAKRSLLKPEVSYFIEISIINRLQTLYQRSGFSQLLQWRFRRVKEDVNNYEDIYDEEVYKKKSEAPNFLSNPPNISFTWNTDGVALFKSSKFSIWPFYLSINELPFKHRTRKENLLLAGLWFGPEKPIPSLFLDNTCYELNALKNGVVLETADLDAPIRVKGEVIYGTFDLPAKALFLSMKHYNSEHGCQHCTIRSKAVSEGSLNRIYPFREKLNLRNETNTRQWARDAVHIREAVFGIKGLSILSRLSTNYITEMAIDAMHCVFLGVVRALLVLWCLCVKNLIILKNINKIHVFI